MRWLSGCRRPSTKYVCTLSGKAPNPTRSLSFAPPNMCKTRPCPQILIDVERGGSIARNRQEPLYALTANITVWWRWIDSPVVFLPFPHSFLNVCWIWRLILLRICNSILACKEVTFQTLWKELSKEGKRRKLLHTTSNALFFARCKSIYFEAIITRIQTSIFPLLSKAVRSASV